MICYLDPHNVFWSTVDAFKNCIDTCTVHFCSGCLWCLGLLTVGRVQPSNFRLALPKLSKRAANHSVPLSLAIPLRSCPVHHRWQQRHHHQHHRWFKCGSGEKFLNWASIFHSVISHFTFHTFSGPANGTEKQNGPCAKLEWQYSISRTVGPPRKTNQFNQVIYTVFGLVAWNPRPRPRTSFEKQKSSNLETVKCSISRLSLDNKFKRS